MLTMEVAGIRSQMKMKMIVVFFMVITLVECQEKPTAPALPAVPACTGTQKPLFVMYAGTKAGGTSGSQTYNDQTTAGCSLICGQNKDPTGADIQCAGYEFNTASKTCTTYTSFDPTQPTADPGTGFFQKACVDSNQACQSAFQFEATPQKLLVGFARQVVRADTINDCLKQCLESYTTFGFECQSIMYYPVDGECILNTESRYKRPDLFVDETVDQVLYFDSNCAGASCFSPYTTAYTKASDISLNDVQGVTLTGVGLPSCEWLCTHRIGLATGEQYNCKSFLYRASDQTCILNDERLKPLGRATSTATPGTDYYEKGCYASRNTCRNPPAFTKYPQMILVGYAAYVVEGVPSVTQCLDLCLSPPPETGSNFQCKSVMYYYTQSECILNTETRETRPDVFTPETGPHSVDYFDIMCLGGPETCLNGTLPSAIRIPNTLIQPTANITLKIDEPGTPDQCRQACYSMSPEKCRSFNYDVAGAKCTLMIINSDSAFPAPTPGTDVYDLLCIPNNTCNETSAFDRTPLKAHRGAPTKTLDAPTALPDCLAACQQTSCAGVNYNVFSGKCDMFTSLNSRRRRQTTTGSPNDNDQLVDNPAVDWYQNSCAGTNGVQTICNFDVFAKMKFDTCRVEVKDSRMAMLTLGFPVPPKPEGGCDDGPDGCDQQTSYGRRQKRQQYGGGQYGGGCSNGGGNCGVLPVVLPERDCGMVDLKNGTYKATIIVQSNNLGIPGLVTSMDQIYDVTCDYSALISQKLLTNATLRVEGPTPALIQPRGKIEISSPVTLQMMGTTGLPTIKAQLGDTLELQWQLMALDEDMDFFVRECIAEPGTITVPVGRRPKVQQQTSSSGYGSTGQSYGAYGGQNSGSCRGSDCAQGQGNVLPPQQLKLVDRGCPTPAVSAKLIPGPITNVTNKIKAAPLLAFRFDGSRSIRIICQLDICEGLCNPTTCPISGKQQTSFGRKKRTPARTVRGAARPVNQDDEEENGFYETEEYLVPKQSSAVATIVIVDPAEEDTAASTQLDSAPKTSERRSVKTEDFQMPNPRRGKVCLPRSTFLAAFLVLVCIALAQAIAITIILLKHFGKKK